jgi:Flp pilus assembly protein TadD, contains TPR repeats
MRAALIRVAVASTILLLTIELLPGGHKEDALKLYREKRFSEAARALAKHLAMHPDDLPMRLLLGLCQQQAGDRDAAEKTFIEAIRLQPRDSRGHFYLARVQFLKGKLDDAEASANRALELKEPPARVYDLLGLILTEKNLPEKALEAYGKAMKADERFPDAYANAGALLLKQGRAREAFELLTRAKNRSVVSSEILYHRGRAALELNQADSATADLAQAASAGHELARRLLEQLRSGGWRPSTVSTQAADLPPVRFRNVASEAGITFVLENHPTPRKHLIETMAGGVAAFDYNNDGLTDLYFTNGASIPSLEKDDPKYFNRLYRNEGGLKFTDVTAEAGVAGSGYSMGAAAADYDNDGDVDLFVAGVNRNLLFRNRGDGTFEEVSEKANIRSHGWAVAGGWVDYDNDGWLDLFIVNYVKWSPAFDLFCGDEQKNFRVYCHPKHFEGLPNTLYRNRGDGTFEDVSERSGISRHVGKGMGVAIADYDQDGFIDIVVTNDTLPNFLFRNRGDGTFEEVGLAAGVALTDDGEAVSSMGVDFRDYDNDGLPDVAITALAGETFPLFRNQGNGYFRDATHSSRVAVLSNRRSGWSNGFFDFNNDGWKDLFSANSHVTDDIAVFSSYVYRQPNSIFANLGNGTFRDVSTEAGFTMPAAHRGAAYADFDGDGRIDVAVSSLSGPAELWRNESPEPQSWIIFKLEGVRSNRDGIGARISVGKQENHMTSAVGYASSSHAGVHFGLGRAEKIERVEIRWPSGRLQVLENVKTGQVLRVREPDR